MSKALVVFSGGQDSTTCLFWARKNFDQVTALAFQYGQRHYNELNAAREIAAEAKVPFHTAEINLFSRISPNALTDHSMEVDRMATENRPPNTLVEGRNMLFLTYAAIFAKAHGIDQIVTGVSQADYSGYPDCRNDFIRSLNQTLNLSMEVEFTIHTPLMWLDKSEVWKMADDLGVFEIVRDQTVTCYHGITGSGCGSCPSCLLRQRGLEKFLSGKKAVATP